MTKKFTLFRTILTCLFIQAFVCQSVFSQSPGVPVGSLSGYFKVRLDRPRQYIWGLGFEIQSDAIASANQGLPEGFTSVPHDLTPYERKRFYDEMLRGFRYCRIAGGLYLRGTTPDGKELRGRWNSQLLEIKEMLDEAGVEGVSLEYWSPPPYWKANEKYAGSDGSPNILKCFGPDFANDPDYQGDTIKFLNDFGESLVNDIRYLFQNGIRVLMWGLQNEPAVDQYYSSCKYSFEEYYQTFKAVAPKVKAFNPNISILVSSWDGQEGYGKMINDDPWTRRYVDAWVWHQIGHNSNMVIERRERYLKDANGRPVFQNEYEYLHGAATAERCINTVQNIMNWFTFVDSPTWFWIHALKPTYNEEASGYSLGFWRPYDDDKSTDIEKGHWKYNEFNWFSLVGFLRYMPWDSRRYAVEEDEVREDNRLLVFKTPAGKLVLVLSNRSGKDFTFRIDAGKEGLFKGYRYTPWEAGEQYRGVPVGESKGREMAISLPHLSWEFWVEQ